MKQQKRGAEFVEHLNQLEALAERIMSAKPPDPVRLANGTIDADLDQVLIQFLLWKFKGEIFNLYINEALKVAHRFAPRWSMEKEDK